MEMEVIETDSGRIVLAIHPHASYISILANNMPPQRLTFAWGEDYRARAIFDSLKVMAQSQEVKVA